MARAPRPTTTKGWHTLEDVERILRSKIPQSDGSITFGDGTGDAMTDLDGVAIMNTQEDNVFLELTFDPPSNKRGALFVEMLARFSAYRVWCDSAKFDEIPQSIQSWYDYALFIQGEFAGGKYDIGNQTTDGVGIKTIITRGEFNRMRDVDNADGGLQIIDTENLT